MKKYFLLMVISFYITNISGQTSNPIVNTFGIHKSYNGTGDMKGFDINVSKRKKINNTFDWYYGSSLTLHFRSSSSVINNGDPSPLKFQTFGIQGESGITFKLFENIIPFHISTSPIVRFQSTTFPSEYSKPYLTLYDSPTNDYLKPIPNNLSVGYKVQLELGLLKIRKSRIFFNSYFQNDTNGDVITGLGFVFKNLNYK
jgi:hypothetical protein